MRIIINGIEAVLKSGTSFDYVTENRYFTGADAYTMAITFPIAGCERNQRIFGNINRKDIQDRNILMDCDIYAKNFHKKGSITVTEITDKAIKCQFLEGRSAENFYSTLDEVYINELNLGEYHRIYKFATKPEEAYKMINRGGWKRSYAVLPWCNNTTGRVHNASKNGKWWNYEDNKEETDGECEMMPYLIYIFQMICSVMGYTYHVEEWENSKWIDLLVCNVVPMTWENNKLNFILPHWSVSEFFEECENLMNCQVNVKNVDKTVTVKFYTDIIKNNKIVNLTNVVNEYTSEITESDESGYNELSVIKYAECSHRMWPFYALDWKEDLINSTAIKKVYYKPMKDIAESGMGIFKGMAKNGYLYVDDETNTLWGRYIIRREPDPNFPNIFEESALFDVISVGSFSNSKKDNEQKKIELSIVPVWLDYVERDYDSGPSGVLEKTDKIIFMECGDLHNDNADESIEYNNQSKEYNIINAGKKEATAIYDKLYVGFYDGELFDKFNFGLRGGRSLPHPIIENMNTLCTSGVKGYFYDERNLKLDGSGARKNTNISINQYEKFNIKFIANEIPDVYSIFLIEGRKFLCKKITATLNEDGMSQLLKGEFYQITD